MITFGELKNSSAINIASVTPSSPQFKTLVNDATRMLMRRGDWEGTVVPMFACVMSGCVVWPRYVGSVRRMNICNHSVHVENSWYTFLPWDNQRWNIRSQNWTGTTYNSWAGRVATLVGSSRSPVFQDVQGDGRQIRAYIETPLDKGKTLTIFGMDNNGQPLTDQSIMWNQGLTVNLDSPYVTFSIKGSPALVRNIERVVKQKTQGRVRLYAYNTATSLLEDLAVYDGSEISPNFLRQNLKTPCTQSCGSNGVLALVKLQYVPVDNDNDLVLIDNEDALKLAMQAVKSREANDMAGAQSFEQMAIRELNLELADANELKNTPVDFGEVPGVIGGQALF